MTAIGRPVLVVCFGDSITGHRSGEPYRHQYLKWCDLLEINIDDVGAYFFTS